MDELDFRVDFTSWAQLADSSSWFLTPAQNQQHEPSAPNHVQALQEVPSKEVLFLLPCAAESAAVSPYYSNRVPHPHPQPHLPPTLLWLFQSAPPLNAGARTAKCCACCCRRAAARREQESGPTSASETLECCHHSWSAKNFLASGFLPRYAAS